MVLCVLSPVNLKKIQGCVQIVKRNSAGAEKTLN